MAFDRERRDTKDSPQRRLWHTCFFLQEAFLRLKPKRCKIPAADIHNVHGNAHPPHLSRFATLFPFPLALFSLVGSYLASLEVSYSVILL
jgi:hypothetical protein